jgi:hypothetical protein
MKLIIIAPWHRAPATIQKLHNDLRDDNTQRRSPCAPQKSAKSANI